MSNPRREYTQRIRYALVRTTGPRKAKPYSSGWTSLIVLSGLLVPGCITPEPLYSPRYLAAEQASDSPFQQREVGEAVEFGLHQKGWRVIDRDPGKVVAKVSRGEHYAVVSIEYDRRGFRIDHVESSPSLLYSEDPDHGRVVHRRYNLWVRFLRDQIQGYLRAKSTFANRPVTTATSAEAKRPAVPTTSETTKDLPPPKQPLAAFDGIELKPFTWDPSVAPRDIRPELARFLEEHLRERIAKINDDWKASGSNAKTLQVEVRVIRLFQWTKFQSAPLGFADVQIDLDIVLRDEGSGDRVSAFNLKDRRKLGQYDDPYSGGAVTEGKDIRTWRFISDVLTSYLRMHRQTSADSVDLQRDPRSRTARPIVGRWNDLSTAP